MAKIINGRFVQKHDIKANWLKATGFIPLDGEIIVYETDETCAYPRFKVGDGATNVNDLPFVENPTQADFAQNDPDAPGYVQNRTHWVEAIEILPETELANMDGMFNLTSPLLNFPEIGKTYTITYNGVQYDCPAVEYAVSDLSGVAMGNTESVGLGPGNTDAPFNVVLFNEGVEIEGMGTMYGGCEPMDAPTSVIIAIANDTVHKLDSKFMSDDVVVAKRPELGVNVIILPETVLTVDEGGEDASIMTPFAADLVIGGNYVVTYNGVDYNCIGRLLELEGVSGVILGKTSMFSVPGGNDSAPFLLVQNPSDVAESVGAYGTFIVTDGATSVTLSVAQRGSPVPKQIVMDKDGNVTWETPTHWAETALVDVLPEKTYSDAASLVEAVAIPFPEPLVAGKEYQVNYNGTNYECTAFSVTIEAGMLICLGNAMDTGAAGGNSAAPFTISCLPDNLAAEVGGSWVIEMTNPPSDIVFPITIGIKSEGEVVHKLDNKYLNVSTPDWNASPSDGGYVKNRTHYCDTVGTITIDLADLIGNDRIVTDSIVLYKVSDYYLDAETMHAATCYVIDPSTGNKMPFDINVAKDNSGYSSEVNSVLTIISVYDASLASAELGYNVPSTGTYVCPFANVVIEIEVGEVLKKLDAKYLPNIVNSINGQIGDITIKTIDTLNLQNSVKQPTATRSIHSINENDYTMGTFAIALGVDSAAGGSCAFAEGHNTSASGNYSHAEGSVTTASGEYSHAEGRRTTASSFDSHAEGYLTKAVGQRSHAEGHSTLASGPVAHAEGLETTASGATAHAEGVQTTASGNYSHAEGYGTISHGYYSHTQGGYTFVNGECGTAIGRYNVDNDPSGFYETAVRLTEQTFNKATPYSIATTTPTADLTTGEYICTSINKTGSEIQVGDCQVYVDIKNRYQELLEVIEETDTTVTYSANHHMIDSYHNLTGTYAIMLGNGDSDNARSNAHAIDWNGNAYYAGDVYVQGNGKTFGFDGKKKLATEEYVESLIPTTEDALTLMIEMGFVDPVTDETGAVYTDENNNFFTY